MKGKFVIIDLRNMDFMKKDGKILFYNTESEARDICAIYEFENAWVMELIHNHIEPIIHNHIEPKTQEEINEKTLRLFGFYVWEFSSSKNRGWFRLFGRGFQWKHEKIRLSFSERNGYKKYIKIGEWIITYTRVRY